MSSGGSSSAPALTAVVMADASHSAFEPLVDCPGTNANYNVPFALMPFANRPLIETLLETLRRNFVTTVYVVCSAARSGPQVDRKIRDIQRTSRAVNSIKIKVLTYGEAPSAAACLRALLAQNQLPDRFVFVPVETVFTSLCLPELMAAHAAAEKASSAVLTVGLNTVPGKLAATYDHLQRQANVAVAAASAHVAIAGPAGATATSPHRGGGGGAATAANANTAAVPPGAVAIGSLSTTPASPGSTGDTSAAISPTTPYPAAPPLPPAAPTAIGTPNTTGGAVEQHSHHRQPHHHHTHSLAKSVFSFDIPKSDGDDYDGDLWTVVYDPKKQNVVRQFASWREVQGNNLRQLKNTRIHSCGRAQLIDSDLGHYTVHCNLGGEVRVQSCIEFTGIAACSAALVTQILQMHGSLISMTDICRCIVENAELTDATFSAHVFSARSGNCLSTQQQQLGGGGGKGGLADAFLFPQEQQQMYRSAFFEMTAGGFQTPPPMFQSLFQSLGNSSVAASAVAAPFGGQASGGAAAAQQQSAAAKQQQQQQQQGNNKPKKPQLPGAPKMSLGLGGGAADAAGAATAAAAISIAAVGGAKAGGAGDLAAALLQKGGAAATAASDGFFAGAARETTQYVPIVTMNSVSSLVRAHVAAASRQLMTISMVMPNYTGYRGHPSVFVNVEGAGASGISVEARIGPNVVIGADCFIPPSAVLQNCCVGDRCTIEDGNCLRDSVVHDDVVFGPGVEVRRSVIGKNARIMAGVKLRNCIVAPNTCVTVTPPKHSRLVPGIAPASPGTSSGSGMGGSNCAPARNYFDVPEAGRHRNFSSCDHGFETDVSILFAKMEQRRGSSGSSSGGRGGTSSSGGGGGGDDDEYDTSDSRERFFRTMRPQIERALLAAGGSVASTSSSSLAPGVPLTTAQLQQTTPLEMLQPMLWRRLLIDLDGFSVSDLLECISRGLLQIVGRRFSHKSGSMPTMTPTSRRSTSNIYGLGGGGGSSSNHMGGGGTSTTATGTAAPPSTRGWDAVDKENAINYLTKNVLQTWIPNLLHPLLRPDGGDLERDQMAIVDGLCRGVGSSEGEIFADGDSCRKILQQFMRFGVFSRGFLDEFHSRMDVEEHEYAEQRLQEKLDEENDAANLDEEDEEEGGDDEEQQQEDGGDAKRGQAKKQKSTAAVAAAATKADSDEARRKKERFLREHFDAAASDPYAVYDDPLFIGWCFFKAAIASAVPMEHTASYVALGALGGRNRSLDSLGAASSTTPKSASPSGGAAFPTGTSPQGKGNKKPAKKQKPAWLARDDDSSSDGSDDDDGNDATSGSSSGSDGGGDSGAASAAAAAKAAAAKAAEQEKEKKPKPTWLARDDSSSSGSSSSSSSSSGSSSSSSSDDDDD